jgi:hypothetical protein
MCRWATMVAIYHENELSDIVIASNNVESISDKG